MNCPIPDPDIINYLLNFYTIYILNTTAIYFLITSKLFMYGFRASGTLIDPSEF